MVHYREPNDVLKLLSDTERYINVCAPMVRYSKIQFRSLVKRYQCDLCFTPMIMADSFYSSEKARQNEFSTNKNNSPLIVQFAANNSKDFVEAASLVSLYCDGVDLNCGCPQRWARQLGVGCILLENPQCIFDIVRECRNRIGKPFTVSVKMRLLKDLQQTVHICRSLEKCGVSFITVHGRTISQQKGEANVDAIKHLVESVNCPVIANGGVTDLDGCQEMYEKTGCKGVMVGNSLLTNPSLFSGNKITSLECVQDWLDICFNSTLTVQQFNKLKQKRQITHPTIPERPLNLTFQCFHHHLVFMLEKILSKANRRVFNNLTTFSSVLNFLDENLGINCQLFDYNQFMKNKILSINYCQNKYIGNEISNYKSENEGKYFSETCDAVASYEGEENFLNIFSESGE